MTASGCLHEEQCECYDRGVLASDEYLRAYHQGYFDALGSSHTLAGTNARPAPTRRVEESDEEDDLESVNDDDAGGDNGDDDHDDDDGSDNQSEYHDAPEDRLDGEEDEAWPPKRRQSSVKTLPPPSSSSPLPPAVASSGPPPTPTTDHSPATPPTTSSSQAAAGTAKKPRKNKSEDAWKWPEIMALGKHMKAMLDEDVPGTVNTERKWHVISLRMRNIDKSNKTWYSVKNKWNRQGRKYFGIDERVRRRTDSMTTGIRNQPAPKIKASERAAEPERPAEAPYQSCTCGAPDAAEGGMIACDGEHELTSWFHYECVGLTAETLPSGNWFCPECMEDVPSNNGDAEVHEEANEEEYEDNEEEYEEEDDEEEYEELPPDLPDYAPQPKRKRDPKDDFDDEYGPDATENTSNAFMSQSNKRIRA
ncbi:hypothetical protein MMC32_000631 [Xylographa parallela]|nr:hypothetical protein [Xylographa parallela]